MFIVIKDLPRRHVLCVFNSFWMIPMFYGTEAYIISVFDCTDNACYLDKWLLGFYMGFIDNNDNMFSAKIQNIGLKSCILFFNH